MKKLRVLCLVPKGSIPPDTVKGHSDKEIAVWKMEHHVINALKKLGHEVLVIDVASDLGVIRSNIEEWKPDIAFNMLEDFHGVAVYDQHVVSYLELMKKHYTGCNPRGLMLAHDKALSKKILSFHCIRTPDFAVFPVGHKVRRPARLKFPLLVKSGIEESSMGISQASVVYSDGELKKRVEFVHEQVDTDALAEEFIEGREIYLGILGNQRLQTFPIWEMFFKKMSEDKEWIATAKVKWDYKYQEKHGIKTGEAKDLNEKLATAIQRLGKRVYKILSLSGYARIDMRLTENGQVYVIEANPNPDISRDEDFAKAAKAAGFPYDKLISRILALGLEYRAEWKLYA